MESIANIIFILHLFLVIFILTAPLMDNEGILMMHAITIPFILLHWAANDNTCCLTVTESYFRKGVSKNDLFFHRLVGPVYEPRHDTFILVGMLTLLGISLYKIYKRKERIEAIFKMMKDDLFGEDKPEEKK